MCRGNAACSQPGLQKRSVEIPDLEPLPGRSPHAGDQPPGLRSRCIDPSRVGRDVRRTRDGLKSTCVVRSGRVRANVPRCCTVRFATRLVVGALAVALVACGSSGAASSAGSSSNPAGSGGPSAPSATAPAAAAGAAKVRLVQVGRFRQPVAVTGAPGDPSRVFVLQRVAR